MLPISIQYGLALMNYPSLFEENVVHATGELPVAEHYLYSFIIFFVFIAMVMFMDTIKKGRAPGAVWRYRLMGIGAFRQKLLQVGALFFVTLLLTAGFFVFLGIKVVAIALCVSCFAYMVAELFDSEAACGFFLFVATLVMLFLSGGIIPHAYLPSQLTVLKYLTVNYWALSSSAASVPVLLGFSLLFFVPGLVVRRDV